MDEINVYQKIFVKLQYKMTQKVFYAGVGEPEKHGLLIALEILSELQDKYLIGDEHE